MRIMAIDPGGTTGWVCHEIEEGRPEIPLDVYGGQLGPYEHHYELDELLSKISPDIVVCEQFTYRIKKTKAGVAVPGINLTSKEYIGVVKLWVKKEIQPHPSLFLPMPAAAVGPKAWWSNDRLKVMGAYTVNEPHRNDATRHLLTHIINKLARRDYLWPFKPND